MHEALPAPDGPAFEIARLRAEVIRLRAALAQASEEARTLRALAHEDALTGLLNRRGFLQDLSRALSYAQRYGAPAALLLADLDAFKPINDRHGHEAGDAALRHVADLLRAHLRGSDLICRLGGDEFAILLWQVDPAAARQKADVLEDTLAANPLHWSGVPLPVAASIGVAPIAPNEDARTVLGRADAAMYARKAARRETAGRSGAPIRR